MSCPEPPYPVRRRFDRGPRMDRPPRTRRRHRWILCLVDAAGEERSLANDGYFDELVVGDWFHVERMHREHWWLRVGPAVWRVWVRSRGRTTARYFSDESVGYEGGGKPRGWRLGALRRFDDLELQGEDSVSRFSLGGWLDLDGGGSVFRLRIEEELWEVIVHDPVVVRRLVADR